jgi:hypothetical protein
MGFFGYQERPFKSDFFVFPFCSSLPVIYFSLIVEAGAGRRLTAAAANGLSYRPNQMFY